VFKVIATINEGGKMVKISKSILLKTIAMGALLTNGCVAAQNEKPNGAENYHATSASSSATSPKISPRFASATTATLSPRASSLLVSSPRDPMMESILTESFLDRTLEEREKEARKALEKPYTFDFSDPEVSVVQVLNLLTNAARQSKDPSNPIKVNINLMNINRLQLENIIHSVNSGHIGVIKHTLVNRLANYDDDDNDAPPTDDALKPSKSKGKGNNDWDDDLKKDNDDDNDDDDDLKKSKIYPDNSKHQKHPNLHRRHLKGGVHVARGRKSIQETDSAKNSVQAVGHLTSQRLVGSGFKSNLENNYYSGKINWVGTSKFNMENNDPKNLGAPNVNSRATPPNLVRIFCKKDSTLRPQMQSVE